MRLLPALLIILLATRLLAAAESDYPRVFRTFMPEAGPSAFAVELAPDLALCYDPLRGGVSQVWRGRIDLAPTHQAKINQPAALIGEVFYRETTLHPLSLGEAGVKAEHRFKGYRYEEGAVVFEFILDGHLVSETLRACEGGLGLWREFALPESGGPAFFQLEPQAGARVRVEGGKEVQPGLWRFAAGARTVFIIQPKA